MYVNDELRDEIYRAIDEKYDCYSIDEEFKYITYPEVEEYRYAIGDYGTVYDIKRGKIVAQMIVNKYLRVGLSVGDTRKQFSVHRLVAWEFVEGFNVESGRHVVNHIDAFKLNNSAYNLEWCTYQENMIHAFNHDGAYSAKRGLKKKDVKRICTLFEQGYSMIEVFRIINGLYRKADDEKMYKVINRIHTRTYYRNISKHYEW